MASLGKDLAAIRKEQALSYEDIYEATKIPKHIIESIEDDSIFTDFNESPTYIRSYVRSYAKALSIKEQKIIYALDQQEIDKYGGSLLETGGLEEEEVPDQAVETEPEPPVSTPPEEHEEADHSGEEELPSETESHAAPTTAPEETKRRSENVDWANMGRNVQPIRPKSNVWIGILVLLFIIVGGLYFLLYSGDNGETADSESVTESEANFGQEDDSLQLNIVPPTEEDTLESGGNEGVENQSTATVPGEALQDTLEVVVYAAYGNLDPVRVYTDVMGNINPYWIEEGVGMRFDFVNEFRIRGSFNNIVLLMNGHVIENPRDRFYNPETRLVEVERSFFERDAKWLQPPPDSLAIDAPAPSEIIERPTYN